MGTSSASPKIPSTDGTRWAVRPAEASSSWESKVPGHKPSLSRRHWRKLRPKEGQRLASGPIASWRHSWEWSRGERLDSLSSGLFSFRSVASTIFVIPPWSREGAGEGVLSGEVRG